MERELYLKKLSRAARWRLPHKEAEEVIADYQELLAEQADGDWGSPVQAVRFLQQGREYSAWLAVFCVMALNLIMPALWMLTNVHVVLWFDVLLLAVGGILGMVWFRRGETAGKRPKALLWLLALLLAVTGAVTGVLSGAILSIPAVLELFNGLAAPQVGIAARMLLEGTSVLAAIMGTAGLVLARTRDRRWLSLYVLGETSLLLCLLLWYHLSAMDISAINRMQRVSHTLWQMAAAGGVGLLGTGWALC